MRPANILQKAASQATRQPKKPDFQWTTRDKLVTGAGVIVDLSQAYHAFTEGKLANAKSVETLTRVLMS